MLVGPDLVFNPVGHQCQSGQSNLSNILLEVPLGHNNRAVYVVISHVRGLMPGLGELDFIKFGLNGSAKAKSVLHPGDHACLGVILSGLSKVYGHNCHGWCATGHCHGQFEPVVLVILNDCTR
jgi:hypothetical protein